MNEFEEKDVLTEENTDNAEEIPAEETFSGDENMNEVAVTDGVAETAENTENDENSASENAFEDSEENVDSEVKDGDDAESDAPAEVVDNAESDETSQKSPFYSSAKVFGISEGQMENEFKSYKAGKLFEKMTLVLTDPYLPIENFKNKLLAASSMGLSSVSVLPNRSKVALKAVEGKIPVYVCIGFPYAIEGNTSLVFSLKKAARTRVFGVEMPLNLADLNEKKLKTIISEYKKYRKIVKKKDFVLIADISRMSPTDLGALAKICKETGIKTVRTSCAERATRVDEYLLNNLKANLGDGVKVVACSTEDGNREVIGIFACGADKFASPNAIDIARGIKDSLDA